MQRHYYAIVAERCGIRVAMRSECDVAEVGDLVSGSNKATVYSGYKVTRDIWKLEPEKEDASDVDI